jgi:preprotein translocase subunit SecE|tara:strand:+ start:71 stop:448 length:378 start_codon:yes stop_codon:yes gene_type:complete
MNAKAETGPSILDTLKLVLAVAFLVGGIVGYYYFEDESILLRVAGVLAGVVIAAVLAMLTDKGRELWRFIQGSRIELRKVIWPTRQETLQTTLTVFVFVFILSIFFWGLDFFLLWATRLLTGQGG